MMSERIFFILEIDIPDLDKLEPHASASILKYEAELVFESNSDFYIKIFFDSSERLDRKLMSWEPKYSSNFFSSAKVTKVISPIRLKHIDFGNYDHKGMRQNSTFYEADMQYFTVKPTGVKLIYEALEQEDSEVYLNHTAFNLIELNYRYQPNFSWKNDEFRFEPINNIKEFIDFNRISFVPEHNFFVASKNSNRSIKVEKEPRFRIRHVNVTEHEIQKHIQLLCDLYSFYTQKKIDWKHSKIFAEGKTFIEFRQTESESNDDVHGIFIWEFIQNPLNLITNVNAQSLIDKGEQVSQLVERFNYAMKANGETKFMILYGLLEQLRNYYISFEQFGQIGSAIPYKSNKVKDKYSFILSKKETNRTLTESLKEIAKIVSEPERLQFESEINDKASQIKLMTMVNQFDSYFRFANIRPEDYGLNFQELKAIRNDIFHGRTIKNKEYLDKANWYEHLPKLIGVLLMKFFGIDDLKKIQKKRVFD